MSLNECSDMDPKTGASVIALAEDVFAAAGGGVLGHSAALLATMSSPTTVPCAVRRMASATLCIALRDDVQFQKVAMQFMQSNSAFLTVLMRCIAEEHDVACVEIVGILGAIGSEHADILADLAPHLVGMLLRKDATLDEQVHVVDAIRLLVRRNAKCRVAFLIQPEILPILVQMMNSDLPLSVKGSAASVLYHLARAPGIRATLCAIRGFEGLPFVLWQLHENARQHQLRQQADGSATVEQSVALAQAIRNLATAHKRIVAVVVDNSRCTSAY
jgi:hypothetical protein